LQVQRHLHPDKSLELDSLLDLDFRKPYLSRDVFHAAGSKDVQEALDGPTWIHKQDTAYLAANPVFIPGLVEFFECCIESELSFSPYSSPFPLVCRNDRINATDPWQKLNHDVILNVLQYLGSDDALNLRLVSRMFAHIPVIHWRRLLIKDAPYLYEAYTVPNILNRWCTYVATEVHEQRRQLNAYRTDIKEKVKVLQGENADLALQYQSDHELRTQELSRMTPERVRLLQLIPTSLPVSERMNWFKLYTGVVQNIERFNGLKNRKKIWEDGLEILRRIEEQRVNR
jgi:hypothetical protein